MKDRSIKHRHLGYQTMNSSKITKVQHRKQKRSCKKNFAQQIKRRKLNKSSPVGLCLKHLTFIISSFMVGKEFSKN